jgi:K+-sensing histidine kinase KdpD
VIESKQQKVNINLPEGFPIINVDVDMLRRVLINLLENAAKFTPVEGNMELGGDVVEGGVRLWVRDSGPGFRLRPSRIFLRNLSVCRPTASPRASGWGWRSAALPCKRTAGASGWKASRATAVVLSLPSGRRSSKWGE